MGLAFAASVLLLPAIPQRSRRPVVFAVCFLIVTWLQMALAKGAGTGPHHTVLLWPFPVLVIAAVFAALSYRWKYGGAALAAGTCLLAASNVAVTSTYYRNQIRNGGTAQWTDAVFTLSETLRRLDVKQVNVVGWVFFDTLRLLHKGRIAIGIAKEPASEPEREFARAQCSNPDNFFVGHAAGSGFAARETKRFVSFAEQEGFRQHRVGVFTDRNGRPILELFRFEKARTNDP
jgi:hypothetical protein